MDVTDPREPNWLPKLIRAARAHDLTPEAAVGVAKILHDDGCARLRNVGVCDCDPDVKLTSRDAKEARGHDDRG